MTNIREDVTVTRLVSLIWLALVLVSHAAPEDSCVKVTRAANGLIDSGSGTIVKITDDGRSLVLTNRHVLPVGNGEICVHYRGRAIKAEWLGVDDIGDLALVAVGEKLPAAMLAQAEPEPGTMLRQWGHPGGGPRVAKKGPALGCDGSRVATTGAAIFWAGFQPEQGDSGAGLFDPDGRLCAVNWGGNTRECCVPLSLIKRFLDKHK